VFALNSMLAQTPGVGWVRLDVKIIGSVTVPDALRLPSIFSENPSANSTRTPGVIVRVTSESKYVSPTTRYVSVGTHVVSESMCPSTQTKASTRRML
jgi:hypothetical protein